MGKKTQDEMVTILKPDQKCIIRDGKSHTKAFAPVQIGKQSMAELVNVDGGLIKGLPKDKWICDNLLYTVESESAIGKITWLIELKGTKNEKEVSHAADQIMDTIGYLSDQMGYPGAQKYIEKRDYVFAAIVGAPDKTLPILNDTKIKKLCRKLYGLSGKSNNINDMFCLLFYVRPNKNCTKMKIQKSKPPYEVICYSTKGGYITFPDDLVKMLC